MRYFNRSNSIHHNVSLVGDGWGKKSQLFEQKTIITNTKQLIKLNPMPVNLRLNTKVQTNF